MTPSFSYMGGKARLRRWLVSLFPKSGRFYLEPFAGLGNVFFLARKRLDFQRWFLGDLDARLLRSMKELNINCLPDRITKRDFEKYKACGGTVANVVESRITFGGMGYAAGFNPGDDDHPPYDGRLYRRLCRESQRLLKDVIVRKSCWKRWKYHDLTEQDFVYLDPPYHGTKAHYPNINHAELMEVLNSAEFRWALSGYDNPLYQKSLKYRRRFQTKRNSEIKGSYTRKRESVIETLWTNYDPPYKGLFPPWEFDLLSDPK